MNRRSFFKFLPFAPLALAAEGARAATIPDQPHDNEMQISITARKKLREPIKVSPHITIWHDNIDPDRQVSMAVGQDGNMWMKTKNGEWRKVALE